MSKDKDRVNQVHVPTFKSRPSIPVTYLPNGWAVAVVDIDPDLATEMLQRNADNQRQLKDAVTARYAQDMMLGKWHLTHQAIAFDKNGKLHDGQHRVSAVVASGETVPFLVFFGAGGKDEMSVIDTNKSRTLVDASKVMGHDFGKDDAAMLNATIRFGVKNFQVYTAKLTNSTKMELLTRNAERLRMVSQWFGASKLSRKLGPTPVRCAIVCASFHVEHETLSRFVSVLTEQADPEPHELAAKSLRQFVTTAENVTDTEVYLKACRAIQLFDAGQNVSNGRLYACAHNPYPLPESFYVLDAV